MTIKKPTLTIGIPAYNEERNISKLLDSLKSQNHSTYTLDQVIVVSDSSTDQTNNIVEGVTDFPITLHINLVRKGIAKSLNYILKNSHSDILITLDADVKIIDKNFLNKIVSLMINKRADYISTSIQESTPKSFFAKCLAISMEIKRNIYNFYNDGNNIYNSFGLARAYTRRLYSKLRFPISIGNDMYSYLYVIAHDLKFCFASNVSVTYFLPTNVTDSSRQSLRFNRAKELMENYFDPTFVRKHLHLPITSVIRGLWSSLPLIARYPFHVTYYLAYFCFTILSSLKTTTGEMWDISTSTKNE